MKATTGLLALGLFTLAGVVTVSCGGSSDDGDSENTAGSSSAGKGTGGAASSAGTTSTTGGSSSTAGSGNGGTNNANNGGRNNNQGGDFPGAGGALNLEECGDGVIDGMPCEPAQGADNACQVNETTYCTCQGRNDPTWVCTDLSDLGQGGAGGGIFGPLTCPANPKTGDACTGVGACPGSTTCVCGLGSVYCQ